MNKIEGIRGQEFKSNWFKWETPEELSTKEAKQLVEESPGYIAGNLKSDPREYLGVHFENGKLKV